MIAARTRIGRIKLKAGGEVRVLHGADVCLKPMATRMTQKVLDTFERPVVGYVFMAWDAAGTSTCRSDISDGSRVPSILVPDFVRNRLLADRIERWTLDSINNPDESYLD